MKFSEIASWVLTVRPPTDRWDNKAAAAARLAARIQTHWQNLGHTNVTVWVEPRSSTWATPLGYDIRSNLVGGLPPVAA